MERYYSQKEESKLIFSFLRFDEICDRRIDLSPDQEFIQVCGRVMPSGIVVPPHRHIETHRETDLTQEAWVVLRGKVRARFYDIDNSFLCERDVGAGDVVVLYRGGHSLEVLEDDTIFYEFKNGPYFGLSKDKEKIDE